MPQSPSNFAFFTLFIEVKLQEITKNTAFHESQGRLPDCNSNRQDTSMQEIKLQKLLVQTFEVYIHRIRFTPHISCDFACKVNIFLRVY